MPLPCLMLLLSPSTGSLLLESLKDHISTTAQDHCKAIYLHVLTTNNTAITFYENRDFKQHHYLPYYYSIRGVLKDGFTYVLYLNGGHPPWTLLYPLPSRSLAGEQMPGQARANTRSPAASPGYGRGLASVRRRGQAEAEGRWCRRGVTGSRVSPGSPDSWEQVGEAVWGDGTGNSELDRVCCQWQRTLV